MNLVTRAGYLNSLRMNSRDRERMYRPGGVRGFVNAVIQNSRDREYILSNTAAAAGRT